MYQAAIVAESRFQPLPCGLPEDFQAQVRTLLQAAYTTVSEGMLLSHLLNAKLDVGGKRQKVKQQMDKIKGMEKELQVSISDSILPMLLDKAAASIIQ